MLRDSFMFFSSSSLCIAENYSMIWMYYKLAIQLLMNIWAEATINNTVPFPPAGHGGPMARVSPTLGMSQSFKFQPFQFILWFLFASPWWLMRIFPDAYFIYLQEISVQIFCPFKKNWVVLTCKKSLGMHAGHKTFWRTFFFVSSLFI